MNHEEKIAFCRYEARRCARHIRLFEQRGEEVGANMYYRHFLYWRSQKNAMILGFLI